MGARTRRFMALLVGPVALAIGFTTGVAAPSVAAPKADPPAVSIPQRYLDQPANWVECSFSEAITLDVPDAPDTLCARLSVPMDWRHPDAHPDIRLAVAWSRATGRTRGVLTLNPGGPGVEGLDQAALLGQAKPALFGVYDLVGFDPRGSGQSTTVGCYSTEAANDARTSVVDPRVRNVATHRVEVAEAAFFGAACSGPELSQFVSTQQTVDDMEFLRRYLGRDAPAYDKLNFVGYSYGTWLGAWYADTYPRHTGRFLLDSNMNWTTTMAANQATDSFSFQRRRDAMFFPWVARHDKTYGYGKTTAAVKKNVEALRARLSKAAARGDAIEDPTVFDDSVATAMFVNSFFPDGIDYILFVESNTPGGVKLDRAPKRMPASMLRIQALLDRAPAVRDAPSDPVQVETSDEPVRCNDSAFSRDLAGLLRRADADAKKYSFVGYVNTVTMCSAWPYRPVSRTIDLSGAPTLLMIQAEGDPATAYEGARAAHRATSGHTRLVSVDNEGEHGIYGYGVSSCADRIGDAFLLRGTLPTKDTVCGTRPLPMDTKVYPLAGPLNGKSYGLDAQTRAARRDDSVTAQRRRDKVDLAARTLR